MVCVGQPEPESAGAGAGAGASWSRSQPELCVLCTVVPTHMTQQNYESRVSRVTSRVTPAGSRRLVER